MISFFTAIIVLIVGYLIYGKFVERVFGIDDSLKTPAIEMQDGVDYVPMNWKKIFLIQFLNIAGLGPIFGAALIIMAIGIAGGLIVKGYQIPELTLQNYYPDGAKSIFPYLFITIACGAISGFHATQSPLMARCIEHEREIRPVFYGSMVAEGIIALIWAAAAMAFYHGEPQLQTVFGATPAVGVNQMSVTLLGPIGAALAVLGVVACPITSGDTAFRSARLTIADSFNIKQEKLSSRFMIAIPLFAVGIALTFIDFQIIWRYFSWANQTLAMIMLWTGSMFLLKNNKNYMITVAPAIFMTAVTFSYIMQADGGLKLPGTVSNTIGVVVAVLFAIVFFIKAKKVNETTGNKAA